MIRRFRWEVLLCLFFNLVFGEYWLGKTVGTYYDYGTMEFNSANAYMLNETRFDLSEGVFITHVRLACGFGNDGGDAPRQQQVQFGVYDVSDNSLHDFGFVTFNCMDIDEIFTPARKSIENMDIPSFFTVQLTKPKFLLPGSYQIGFKPNTLLWLVEDGSLPSGPAGNSLETQFQNVDELPPFSVGGVSAMFGNGKHKGIAVGAPDFPNGNNPFQNLLFCSNEMGGISFGSHCLIGTDYFQGPAFPTEEGYIYYGGGHETFRSSYHYRFKGIQYQCVSAEANAEVTVGIYDGSVKLIKEATFEPICDGTLRYVTLFDDVIYTLGDFRIAFTCSKTITWYSTVGSEYFRSRIPMNYAQHLPAKMTMMGLEQGALVSGLAFIVELVSACFGVETGDPNMCSGNGQCVDSPGSGIRADVCVCYSGYSGGNCQIPPEEAVKACTPTNELDFTTSYSKNGAPFCAHLIRSKSLSHEYADLECRKRFFLGTLFFFDTLEEPNIHRTAPGFPSPVEYWYGIIKRSNSIPTSTAADVSWTVTFGPFPPVNFFGFEEENLNQLCGKLVSKTDDVTRPYRGDGRCSVQRPFMCMYPIMTTCFGVPAHFENACSGNGVCVLGVIGDVCVCNEGYVGSIQDYDCSTPVCYDIPAYNSTVCNNGQGVCNAPDDCACIGEWTGDECDEYMCWGKSYLDVNVCGGIAFGQCEMNHECTCKDPDKYVDDCTVPICFNITAKEEGIVCSGYGTCESPNECLCDDYHGHDDCSLPKCNEKTNLDVGICGDRGSCRFVDETETSTYCDCTNGYFGAECEQFTCVDDCNGNGDCYDYNKCNCKVGFDGFYCEEWECFGVSNLLPDLTCSERGDCITNETCSCTSPYYGGNCELYNCGIYPWNHGDVCNQHGDCNEPNKCSCIGDWFGDNCGNLECVEVPHYDPLVCSGKGSCNDTGDCTCQVGWTGNDCSLPICDGKTPLHADVCNGNGFCTSPGVCECFEGYSLIPEEYCEFPVCYGLASNENGVCSNNGICESPNNCKCSNDDNYEGDNCELHKCNLIPYNDPSVCSGNGDCLDDTFTCQCENSYLYSGSLCEEKLCYGKDKTHPLQCSGHGNCIDLNTCECVDNWGGLECEFSKCGDYYSNEKEFVCSGNGVCLSNHTCSCYVDYSGDNCESVQCNGVPFYEDESCNEGRCLNDGTCDCLGTNFIGKNCEIPLCYGHSSESIEVCNGHGLCNEEDHTCTCHAGYDGFDCHIVKCYGLLPSDVNVCNGNGGCMSNGECNCNYNWGGEHCDVPICHGILGSDSSVCNGHGFCNDNKECDCNNGYIKTHSAGNCDIPLCYGISSLDTLHVCSGNGYCNDNKTCTCNEGWSGIECEIQMCYDVRSDNVNVCNGNGECNENHHCECYDNYRGERCEISLCYEKEENDEKVCNGHGDCDVDTHFCNCHNGWTGAQCTLSMCNDIPEYDVNVCNGNGICSKGECHCNDFYAGTFCDVPTCNGIPVNDDTFVTCRGRGVCVNFRCICDEGYEGDDCEKEKKTDPNYAVAEDTSVSNNITAIFVVIIIIVVIVCVLCSITWSAIIYCYCKAKPEEKERKENDDENEEELVDDDEAEKK